MSFAIFMLKYDSSIFYLDINFQRQYGSVSLRLLYVFEDFPEETVTYGNRHLMQNLIG